MKTWYKAVCDQHKEMLDIFVNNVATTAHYLTKDDNLINDWLSDHYGCSLRLIHHDLDMDECFNNGYKVVKEIAKPEPTTISIDEDRFGNGPDGYPKNNTAFDELKEKVLAKGKENAEKAKKFLDRLRKTNE